MKCKHLLFTAIAIATTSTLSAQVSKGDILLGASLGTGTISSSSTGSNTSNSNANLSPRIGFGIGNNSILGARFNVAYGRTKSEGSDGKSSIFSYGAFLYWRKLLPISKQIGWYVEPYGGISSTRYSQTSNNNKSKSSYNTIIVGAAPGIYYQPLNKLMISADFGGLTFGHGRNKQGGVTVSKSSDVNLTLLQRFNFGIDFILGKKA